MKNATLPHPARTLLAALLIVFGAAQAQGQKTASQTAATLDLSLSKPESVGFSSERLERLHALMQQVVDRKEIAGIVTILARHGKVIDYRAYGQRDMASGSPMTKDTIFRDFSMMLGNYSAQPTTPSGGGGLVSTAEDYLRFARMLANEGALNGMRVLSPAAVHLMASNHLAPNLLTGEFAIGLQRMRPGFGYGYDCAVVFNPPEADLPDGQGTFFWDGAAGTWFWVDPANDIAFVGMIQRMLGPASPNLEYLSRSVVYQALVNPKM